MSTQIIPCHCPHAFQDARYGKGQRAHNATGRGVLTGWRCTACGRMKGVVLAQEMKGAKK